MIDEFKIKNVVQFVFSTPLNYNAQVMFMNTDLND